MPKSPAFDLQPDEFTGQKFGQYELICQLAEGGMSQLFLGVRRGEGGFTKLVVLKRIAPDLAADSDFVQRLLEEGHLMGGFSHPNIAQVFDVGREGEQYFLVLELVSGVSLLELLRAATAAREVLPVELTLAVGRAAAEALHHAHAFVDVNGKPRPVIHRDVAPKNIMVTFDGDTKLIDFGIAKSSEGKTHVGRLIGTPRYMSPEQAALQPLDARSDVFSLGVTLYECLTGKRVFAAENMAAELQAVTERRIGPPSDQNPDVTPAVDQAVMRALARQREDRYSTARDFARALEAAAGGPLWGPERVAAVVQRFFGDRRELSRQRLQTIRTRLEQGGPTVIVPPAQPEPQPVSAPAPVRWRLKAAIAAAALAAVGLVWFALAETSPPPAAAPGVAAAPSVPPPPAKRAERVEPPPAEAPAAPAPEPSLAPPVRVAAAPRKSPRPAAANGSLWVKVRPWARVFVDGRLRGETPLDPFEVSAGHHTVLLLNDQLKLRKSYEIDLRPNEERELKVVLEQ